MDLIGSLHFLYKRWLSPVIGRQCRFFPSCSDYCLQSVRRFGYPRGALLTVTRLSRCHPFALAGYDPIPERFRWRSQVQAWPSEADGPNSSDQRANDRRG